MKIIMLRDLDENPEIVRIVRAYMACPRVATKAATVAVESFIRQFDRGEKDSFEYRQRTGQELHELRDEVTRLTWDRGVDVRNINAFRAAFKDLMSDSWGSLYVADSRLQPTAPTVLAPPCWFFSGFRPCKENGKAVSRSRPGLRVAQKIISTLRAFNAVHSVPGVATPCIPCRVVFFSGKACP